MNKNVLVLGGGIGGVEAACALCRKGFNVELISERPYLYIYPLSIWIPTGEASWNDVVLPLDKVADANGFTFTQDRVEKISVGEGKVVLGSGEVKTYDYLVIALGGSKVKHKGQENFLSICGKPEESLLLKEKIEKLLSRGGGTIAAGFGGNPKDPTGVRGGPAFEFIFNVDCLLRKRGLRENFKLHFFAPMPKPGIRLGEKNAERAYKMLDRLGIERHFGKKISEFTPEGVLFEDGSLLRSDLVMFIPATAGHPVFKESDLPLTEAGFIKIEKTCAVVGTDERVWAIGDSAAFEGPKWKAKQGHIAEVMGRIVARNIEAKELGEAKREEYVHHLHILCLMDMGPCPMSGAMVYRDEKRSLMIPLPLVGHRLKKLWGWYYKKSKLGKIPRIPGFDAP